MSRTGTRWIVGLLALAPLALLICHGGAVHAQAKKSDSVVKVAVKADDKPDAEGKQTLTITLDIHKDWHVYANPVRNEDLENAQTVVRVVGKNRLEDVKIAYPPGKAHGEKDTRHNIYDGKVTIKAQVKRTRGDDGPLEVTVQFQACDKSTCLFPATIKKEVR